MNYERDIIKKYMELWCCQNSHVRRCLNRIKDYDYDLYNHSINVGILSFILGLYVFKDYKDVENIYIAGLLHDFGKLFVPKEILNKAGYLTKEEKEKIKMHTILGYEYLKKENHFNKNILLGILDHHERIDGSGYINGKKEADISQHAKLIMVADIYDALISDRIYRAGIKKELVSNYLLENAGKTLSIPVVQIFYNITSTIDLESIFELAEDAFEAGMYV